MSEPAEIRAEAVHPPQPTRALERARAEQQEHRNKRELLERRSVVRGLIVLAVVALVFSVARAGLDRVFVHGWWRQW
jgi:hypothetical protein